MSCGPAAAPARPTDNNPLALHSSSYPPSQSFSPGTASTGSTARPTPARPTATPSAPAHTRQTSINLQYHPYAVPSHHSALLPSSDKPAMFVNASSPARPGTSGAPLAAGPSSSAATGAAGAHDPAASLPRPKRKKITQHQLERLTALFEITDSPSFSQREEVGNAVEPTMTSREVQVWFQNRRAKVNRLKAQQSTSTLDPMSSSISHSPSSRADPSGAKSQWRFKPTPTHDAPLALNKPTPPVPSSTFQLPNPNRLAAEPAHAPLRSATDPFQRSPVLAQSQAGPHRRVFTGPPIQIPARHSTAPSRFASHHTQSITTSTDSPRSPSSYSSSPSVVGSPFFGVHSPTFAFSHSASGSSLYQPLGAGTGATPGLSSHSSVGSGYFSALNSASSGLSGSEWPPPSPHTPGSLHSPSTHFFKLSLSDSPRDTRWERGAPLGSPSSTSALSPTTAEMVKLPPIISSPRRWRPHNAETPEEEDEARGEAAAAQRPVPHKRSFSDTGSVACAPARKHKLPSLRNLVDSITRKVSSGSGSQTPESAQRSPVELAPLVVPTSAGPPTLPRSATMPRLGEGLMLPPPSPTRARTPQASREQGKKVLYVQAPEEADDEMDTDLPAVPDGGWPLGLGMLAVAASTVSAAGKDGRRAEDEAEAEREKEWRLRQTRRLSYDVGAARRLSGSGARPRSGASWSSAEGSGNSSGMETAR